MIRARAFLDSQSGPLEVIFASDYGMSASASPTVNATAFNAAIAAAAAARKPLRLPTGEITYNAQANLPTFTAEGNAWDEDNPIVIFGAGPNQTILHYTGTDPYAIAHPSIGGTTNRGQNYGVEFYSFTLKGPQDWANAAHGIGIDNTRRPIIRDVRFVGFPGGVFIHLYGHRIGGLFGAQIYDCYFGNNVFTQSGGFILQDLDLMALDTARYAVWCDGPYNSGGKVNDIYFHNNTIYETVIGGIKIEGHGVWDGVSSQGSSANIVSTNNVFFFQSGRKMEEGTLSSVTDESTMCLRLTDFIYNSDGDFGPPFYLSAKDNEGRWHGRYIATFTGAPREVTLEAALPFTPIVETDTAQAGTTDSITLAAGASATDDYYKAARLTIVSGTGAGQWVDIKSYTGSTNVALTVQTFDTAPDATSVYVIGTMYRIGFADAAAKADFPNPDVLQHCFRWASQYSMVSHADYAEETMYIAAHQYANNDVSVSLPEDVVNDTIYSMYDDGTWWAPRLFLAQRPRGSDETPAAAIMGPILVMNSQFEPEPAGVIMRHMKNATGGTLVNGDVVRIVSASSLEANASVDFYGISGHFPHCIVYNPQNRRVLNGKYMTAAVTGANVDVTVVGPVTIGDLIIPIAGNVSVALPGDLVSESDTAQGPSGVNGIQLAAGANARNYYYSGLTIRLLSGTGSGQTRTVLNYTGATQIATVDRSWSVNPDNTTVYEISGPNALMSRILGRAMFTDATDTTRKVRCTVKGF